jgi:hypothetical protein
VVLVKITVRGAVPIVGTTANLATGGGVRLRSLSGGGIAPEVPGTVKLISPDCGLFHIELSYATTAQKYVAPLVRLVSV